MIFQRILLCCSLFLSVLTMAAQEETADTTAASLPTDVSAHYVLVTPGETASSILGHAAIRMSCPSQGLDYCFTIKTPEIREEVIDMLFGHLRIGLVPEETSHFRQTYMKEGRGIIEYRLALSLDDTRRLWQQLDGQVARGLYLDLDYVNNSCTQVAIDQLYEQLRTRSDLQIDEVIRKTIPVQTRREAVLRYFDQSTWWGFLLHSCYSYYPDEKVSPRRLVVMPQDAAAVFREAGLVTEETVVAKQEKSAPSSGGAWLTPLLASALFFLLCLLPFRQVDWLAVPLQILSLLLFILLSVFSHASGIGFNWLILALFPLTAPVGIVYMLCHMGDIYSLAQLLFVLGFFVRALYYLYHHRNQVKKIILFKFINHSSI